MGKEIEMISMEEFEKVVRSNNGQRVRNDFTLPATVATTLIECGDLPETAVAINTVTGLAEVDFYVAFPNATKFPFAIFNTGCEFDTTNGISDYGCSGTMGRAYSPVRYGTVRVLSSLGAAWEFAPSCRLAYAQYVAKHVSIRDIIFTDQVGEESKSPIYISGKLFEGCTFEGGSLKNIFFDGCTFDGCAFKGESFSTLLNVGGIKTCHFKYCDAENWKEVGSLKDKWF